MDRGELEFLGGWLAGAVGALVEIIIIIIIRRRRRKIKKNIKLNIKFNS